MSIFSKLFNRNRDKKEEQTDAPSLSPSENIEAMNESLRNLAYQLFKEGNYDKAFPLFKTVAEDGGDLDAIFNLAMCYYHGYGTEQDIEKYIYWLKKAAALGDDQAMYNIAILYHDGKYVERNLDEAIIWYKQAAEKGNERAINELKKLGFR